MQRVVHCFDLAVVDCYALLCLGSDTAGTLKLQTNCPAGGHSKQQQQQASAAALAAEAAAIAAAAVSVGGHWCALCNQTEPFSPSCQISLYYASFLQDMVQNSQFECSDSFWCRRRLNCSQPLRPC